MDLTLEEELLIKTAKYQDDVNTALLLETKQFSIPILEKILVFASFNNSAYLVDKLLSNHKLPSDSIFKAFWLSVNEDSNDAFTELQKYLSSDDMSEQKIQAFESDEKFIQNVIEIVKYIQE